jgi:hypothetical protein
MTLLRGAIGRVGIVWLLCQVATLTMAPTILWLGSSVELLECTCAHGDHAICPMHHRAAPGSKLCVMGSAQSSGAAVLTSLFGGVGPVPTRAVAVPPEPRRVIAIPEATAASLRPAPPDPPPPRA